MASKTAIPPEVTKRVDQLVKYAKKHAYKDLRDEKAAKKRVDTAIDNRLRPYILEAEMIAHQLQTDEYQAFVAETKDFLGSLVGFVVCPDGRIAGLSLGDPVVSSIYRKLRGMPSVRLSSESAVIPKDRFLRSAIWSKLKSDKYSQLVEFVGPHIYSLHPHHGCGAAAGKAKGFGSGLPQTLPALHFGGIQEYFADAEAAGTYSAFDTFAHMAGGRGTTFDITHDISTQGLIYGLQIAHKDFQPSKSLRANLLILAKKGSIVMSELLVERYQSNVVAAAKKFDAGFRVKKPLEYCEFTQFAENAMLIGRIAQSLTTQEERKGFSFIPARLQKGTSKKALRVLAYHLLRNTVYQILGAIRSDKHVFTEHPEQVLRVGPIGADYNLKTVAFINNAPEVFSENNINSTFALYQLMGTVLSELNIDMEREARIVTVTSTFDTSVYTDEGAAQPQFEFVATQVKDNTALVKKSLQTAVERGYAVVLPVIHHRRHRAIIDII